MCASRYSESCYRSVEFLTEKLGFVRTPISRLAPVPFILVVHPSMPVKSLGDLIALARAKSGER